MTFLFRKVEDVTTISKSQSLTSVSIKDCTLRVPNKTTTLFLYDNNKSNFHFTGPHRTMHGAHCVHAQQGSIFSAILLYAAFLVLASAATGAHMFIPGGRATDPCPLLLKRVQR